MTEEKIDIKSLDMAAMVDFLAGMGLPPFRARQIFAWLYKRGVNDFATMTDIAARVREELEQRAKISKLKLAAKEKSRDGAVKFAFALDDANLIESVVIPEEDRNTLCVSSQVGCAMDCSFCLTACLGFKRNLTPAEIVGQICAAAEHLPPELVRPEFKRPGNIHNLVFMGMDEPLANFENLVRAIKILMDPQGFDFSGRKITVSTCGLVPQMRPLGEAVPVNLAVSLHSVRNEVRDRLMPINKRYPVEELLAACRDFPLPPRRAIMFEYIMLAGINDSIDDARLMARMLKDIRCKINLLPYNENPKRDFKCPDRGKIIAFQNVLRQAGYAVFIRDSRGDDISAACGQLAGKDADS